MCNLIANELAHALKTCSFKNSQRQTGSRIILLAGKLTANLSEVCLSARFQPEKTAKVLEKNHFTSIS